MIFTQFTSDLGSIHDSPYEGTHTMSATKRPATKVRSTDYWFRTDTADAQLNGANADWLTVDFLENRFKKFGFSEPVSGDAMLQLK